jgi:hypothetical protein
MEDDERMQMQEMCGRRMKGPYGPEGDSRLGHIVLMMEAVRTYET